MAKTRQRTRPKGSLLPLTAMRPHNLSTEPETWNGAGKPRLIALTMTTTTTTRPPLVLPFLIDQIVSRCHCAARYAVHGYSQSVAGSASRELDEAPR